MIAAKENLMPLPGIALSACAGLLAVLLTTGALAQADKIEEAIGQSQSSTAIREMQAQARAEVPTTDDKHELAIFYHKRGFANSRLGNYGSAVDDLRLALENTQPKRPTPDQWGNRWRIQNELGNTYEARGDWFSAIDLWNSVAQSSEQSDGFHFHFAQLRLMSAYGVLGQLSEADKARQVADATLSRLRGTPQWATFGFNALYVNNRYTAVFFSRQGNGPEAERRYRASLEAAEKYLPVAQDKLGNNRQEMRVAIDNIRTAKTDLADALATQGKYAEAEAYARAGLEGALASYGFNTTAVGYALLVVGWTRFQQGDIAGAEMYYRYAVTAVEGSGVVRHSTTLAERRAALANAQIVQGRWSDALKVFEERDRGLASDAAQFKRYGSRHVSWAYALHKTGRSELATRRTQEMLTAQLRRPVPDRWYVAQLRGVLGMALAASGKTAEALKAFQESVPELIRRDQDDATAENTGYWRAFWQRVILESYLDLLAKLYASGEAVANLDIVAESFRIADIARGSSVQEAISATAARAQLPDRNLVELARKEQDALNRIVALNRILSGLAGSTDARSARILSDMRTEIERLRKEHADLRTDIRKRYPEYAELIDPKPAGIDDVRKAFAPGEAMVSIYLGESQSYVWTIVAGGKAGFRVVPLKREEIERDVRELRKAMDFGEGTVEQLRPFDLGLAHKLYRAYFEPDEAMWKEAQILNIVPNGALGELPFALLVTAAPAQQPAAGAQAAYRDVPWLARKVAIAQLPSASAFAALRRTPPGKAARQPFVGFGDPLFVAAAAAGARRGVVRNLTVQKVADAAEAQFSAMAKGQGAQQPGAALATRTLSQSFALFSALPDTSDELREIAATLKADPARDVFLGRAATEKNVKQARLENARVVAFATHGIASGELTGLDQPALVLSNPALSGDNDNDGFLTMEEVLALKLDADWVVLSACNTAAADGRASEAVSGLGRAFFYAGARSLLVSNWAVETTSARLLTTEVFRRQSENPQMTRAEALRQAMLALMARHAIDPANKQPSFSYAHPAFWAPFSLVGDGSGR
ncbi:MAG: CHAT domain-containing protein [Betaproteobacteria bacterium]|nr:CHAT domain-containing protein [Betaproteobacteria bacterium]